MTHALQPLEHPSPWCQLETVVVDGSHRRRGIGQALVEAAETRALAEGCEGVMLTTAEHRADARQFYETLGYEISGVKYRWRLNGRATTSRASRSASAIEQQRDRAPVW